MRGKTQERPNQTFLQGALILTASMVIVKIIGALFKIPLANILGAEGNGYFNAAYDLYNPLYALSTAGFPIAISRLVSENVAKHRFRDVRKIYKVARPIFLITGTVSFLAMALGTFVYVRIVKAPQVKYATLALAPTVLFACLMSIYRGYYEGLRNMIPTAISEIIESFFKMILGLGLAYGVIAYGLQEYANHGTVFGQAYDSAAAARSATLPFAAAGAILGITLASMAGFFYLFIRHKLRGDGITDEELRTSPKARTNKETFRKLIMTAFPIGLGAVVMNISSLIDSTIVLRRLSDIMSSSPAKLLDCYAGLIQPDVIARGNTHLFLYGCYGYAATIMMLIPTLTQVFAISALPSVTTAWAEGSKKQIKYSIESVIKITTLVTIPAGLGLTVLSHPIMSLLYGNKRTAGEVYIASSVLVILGLAAIFSSTSTPLCSILQAVGRVDLPVKLLTIGVAIKIILNYVLVGIPEINIQGAGIGSLVCYGFVSAMAVYFICKETGIVPDLISVFIRPLICGICCAVAAYAAYGLVSSVISAKISTILAILIAGVIYLIALFAFRAITKDDVIMLPKGEKISKILEKYHLLG